MSIIFPKELLESLNIGTVENEEKEAEDKNTYKDSTYLIVSKVAYLSGVPEEIFSNEHHPPKMEYFKELDKNKNARIIRNLCILRTAIERNYSAIFKAVSYGLKNLNTLPEYISQSCLKQLKDDGISIIKVNTKPADYIIAINKLISDKINNCREIFPIWINWQYINALFVMPKGNTEEGIKAAAEKYYSNLNSYPYQVYLNWNYFFDGNIFYNDKKFVTLLYESHDDRFTDMTKVSDAGEKTKEGIYAFLKKSKKVCIMVDCENSDPYKLYATLKNLKQETLIEKIDKIILYDDVHTTNAWAILSEFTEIETEHIVIERVKDDKSLVDIRLTTGTCKEFYQNQTDSFILVSSDSDYWGLITSLPDARFLVMVEWEKCGHDIKAALDNYGITYCYIDDFCTGNSDEIKVAAVLNEVRSRLNEEVHFNAPQLFAGSLYDTRADFSDSEKKQMYDKYIKKMQLKIDADGNVSIELGK